MCQHLQHAQESALSLQSISEIRDNKDVMDALRKTVINAGVLPFVGAGMSVPFGIKAWTEFLSYEASRSGVPSTVIALVHANRLEEAAEDLSARRDFHHRFEATFARLPVTTRRLEAAWLIPFLTRGPVITTNYDRVLEHVFENTIDCGTSRRFEAAIWGAMPKALHAALYASRPCLIKIHGDVLIPDSRILTYREYQQAYFKGRAAKRIDWEKPLPAALRFAIEKRPLLFLGCSLSADRLMQIVQEVISCSEQTLPNYAIAQLPQHPDQQSQRLRFMDDHGLLPIWYPEGRHECLKTILEHLTGISASTEIECSLELRDERPTPPVPEITQIRTDVLPRLPCSDRDSLSLAPILFRGVVRTLAVSLARPQALDLTAWPPLLDPANDQTPTVSSNQPATVTIPANRAISRCCLRYQPSGRFGPKFTIDVHFDSGRWKVNATQTFPSLTEPSLLAQTA